VPGLTITLISPSSAATCTFSAEHSREEIDGDARLEIGANALEARVGSDVDGDDEIAGQAVLSAGLSFSPVTSPAGRPLMPLGILIP